MMIEYFINFMKGKKKNQLYQICLTNISCGEREADLDNTHHSVRQGHTYKAGGRFSSMEDEWCPATHSVE